VPPIESLFGLRPFAFRTGFPYNSAFSLGRRLRRMDARPLAELNLLLSWEIEDNHG
jgi:hypothetical protein